MKTQAQNHKKLERLANRVASLEQQLTEQDAIFQQLAEEAGNGYWRWNLSSGTLQLSPKSCRFLKSNHKQDFVQPERWSDILPLDEDAVLRQIVNTLRPNGKSNFEFLIKAVSPFSEPVICYGSVIEWNQQERPEAILGFFKKVPDEHSIQSNLTERKKWFRWMAKYIPGVFIFLFDRDYRYSNYEDYNYTEHPNFNRIIGKTLDEVANPDEVAFLKPIYEEVLAGNSLEREVVYQKKSYYSQFIPYYNEGEITHGLVFSLDITQTKGFEQKLASFIEQAPAAMAVFDTNMHYIAASQYWNDSFTEGENIIGESYYGGFSEITDEWKNIHQDCLKGNSYHNDDERVILKDGSEVWLQWEVKPWYTTGNDIGGLIIIAENITDRKKSELALHHYQQGLKILTQISANHQLSLEEKLQELLISVATYFDLPNGMINQVKSKIQLVEYAICLDDEDQKFEAGTELPLPNTYCGATFTSDDTIAISSMDAAQELGNTIHNSYGIESYIGSPLWVAGKKYGTICFFSSEKRISPFTENEVDFMRLVARWVGTTLERSYTQRQIITAREEAEEATQAKTDFLSTMSHEIRTPMNAVIGMTHLLMEENPRDDQLKSLKTLKFSADLLLSLINDILDFSKIESGKIELEFVDFNLKNMLHGIKAAQGTKAQEKHVKLKLRWDEDVPLMVVGDMTRLGQIINNLVSNAVKFTQEGEVSIEIDLIEEKEHKVRLSFKVRDTGIGISENQIEAIFEEFSQASSSTTRKFGGTGLGLAITKKLLELQGSQIEVTSEVGVGSVFSFKLELRKSNKVVNEAGATKSNIEFGQSLEGLRVLLVEDNPVNQYVVTRFIKKWEASLDIANNGQEAVEKVKQKSYDVILMDIQMPIMDGYESTKQIRAWEQQEEKDPVYIIALTASATLAAKDKVKELGMDEFLTKPFDPKELFARLIAQWKNEEIKDDYLKKNLAINLEVFEYLTNGDQIEQRRLCLKIEKIIKNLVQEVNELKEKADFGKYANNLQQVKSNGASIKVEPLSNMVLEMAENPKIINERICTALISYCHQILEKIQKYKSGIAD